MQAMWNKVGVKATIKVGGRGPGFFRPLFAGKLHAFTYIIPTPIDPFNAFNNYHSKHPFNYLKIKDPNIDGALARLKKARGRDARYKASCAIQQLVIDQARYISYENPSNTFAFTSKVKGVTKPINNVFDVHRLWIEK
jgi:ABC-type transport system substrate-binding protein